MAKRVIRVRPMDLVPLDCTNMGHHARREVLCRCADAQRAGWNANCLLYPRD